MTPEQIAHEREQIPSWRDQEMHHFWKNETTAPESRAWRNDLTPAEKQLVADWDRWHEEGSLSKGPKCWEIVTEPNCVDNYNRPCRHARCPHCGFTWTNLYHVKNYFNHCPRCGQVLKWPE